MIRKQKIYGWGFLSLGRQKGRERQEHTSILLMSLIMQGGNPTQFLKYP